LNRRGEYQRPAERSVAKVAERFIALTRTALSFADDAN
jgi:hypothetical protein